MMNQPRVAHIRFIDERTEATAIEYLKWLRDSTFLPMLSIEGSGARHFASNAELRRWLKTQSVHINGVRPLPGDTIQFPIMQLIFFPNGKRQSTVIMETT